jgi:glycosyltransferase involved in cell wall biosynthesis
LKVTEGTRKILIVSYHFPPDAEVGGTRPAKFAKYLPEFGWTPYVLTIKEKHIAVRDEDRLKELKEVRIFRTAVWPNVLEFILGLRNRILRAFGIRRKQNDTKPSRDPEAGDKRAAHRRFPLLRRVIDSLFELPDKNVGWIIPAVWKGFWLIKREKIGIVFTTAPPPTASVAGYILAKLTGARLITDLRDPWLLHEGKPATGRTKFSDAIERWVERRITYNSRRMISTTEHYTDFLRSRYPDLPKDHFCTIWNGFDSADFGSNGYPDRQGDSFVVSYLGTFYYGRTPKEVLQALGELVREGVISKVRLEINFIGDVHYAEGTSVEELIRRNALDGCVNLSGKIPYKESLRQMKRANVLLLFAPEQYYAIPGKAFEYLCSGTQILCFAKEGATSNLIRRTGGGLVVDPYDLSEIKSAIRDLYRSWRSKTEWTCKSDIQCFERRELTRQLSVLLLEAMPFGGRMDKSLRTNGRFF